MSRRVENPFIALNDGNRENRMTGALMHVASVVPSVLKHICLAANLPETLPTARRNIELRKAIPNGELDAIVYMDQHMWGGSALIIEAKRFDIGDECTELQGDRQELNQLKRYAQFAHEQFGEAMLLYLTRDSVEPNLVSTLRGWLKGKGIDNVRLGWTSWERVHEIAETIANRKLCSPSQTRLVVSLAEYLEEVGMVVERLTESEKRKLRRVPDDMVDIWVELDTKGYEMIRALRSNLAKRLKLPLDDDHFNPSRRVSRYHSIGDVATWFLYVRQGTQKPFWACVDLSLPLGLYEVSIRMFGRDDNLVYLRQMRDGRHTAGRRFKDFDIEDEDWLVRDSDPLKWSDGRLVVLAKSDKTSLEELSVSKMYDDVVRGLRVVEDLL